MDDDSRGRVERWLETRWREHRCPVCHDVAWTVGNDLGQIPTYPAVLVPRTGAGGGVYPVLPVFCTNCGYTELINALIAGVTGAETPPDEPSVANDIESSGVWPPAPDRPPGQQ